MSWKLKGRKISRLTLLLSSVLFLLFLGITTELVYAYQIMTGNSLSASSTTPKEAATVMLQACGGNRNPEQCYVQQFGQFAKKNELNLTIATLKEVLAEDPNSRGCHLIAHTISIAETSKNPDKWLETLVKMDDNLCSGGLMHGVLEAHSRYDPNFELNAKSVTNICNYVKDHMDGESEQNCSHSLGHILLAEETGNIADATAICGKLHPEIQYECYSGVFMENETRDNLVAHGVAQRINWDDKTQADQEAICRKYTGDAAKACWREMAHFYAFTSGNDPREVYKLCQRANVADAFDDCYFHGIGIMSSSSFYDPSSNKYMCEPFASDPKKYQMCIDWFVGSEMASTIYFADKAFAFCTDILPDYKKECDDRVRQLMHQKEATDRVNQICSSLPKDFQHTCYGAD